LGDKSNDIELVFVFGFNLMATDILERVKYEKRYWYDNMKPNETLLWERFLDKYPGAYDEVVYNLKIGEGAEIPDGTEENLARGFKELTQLKIDVVGFKGDRTDLIELKPEPRASVLTQLKGYQKLFARTIKPVIKTNLVMVTYAISPDMETILEGEGIDVIIV
jgi:hypothetical protein